MNIPSQSGQGPAVSNDYQSLYGARAGKSTFAQTIAQSQSSYLSLTTAEGDLVTLSDLSLSYQQAQGVGWFTPAASGMNFSSSSTTAETMGLSVQGDLNAQELADISRLMGELTSIASAFFSGDYDSAMTKALDFGDLSMGSISSLSASFSSQTVTQTKITSHNHPLPAMADLNDLDLKDFYESLGTDSNGELDYAQLLEARWQQILKALDEMKAEELDGLYARRPEPQPVPVEALNAESTLPPAEAVAPVSQPPASDPSPVLEEAEPTDLPFVSAPERAARQMLARMEQLFADHPKFTPFAKALAATAIEKAAARTAQPLPDTARAFGALRDAFLNQLHQWFLPPTEPATAEPLTEV